MKLDEQIIARMLDKLDKTHEVVTVLDKKLDLHIQRTEQEFESIKVLDEQQNQLLAEHAKRSDRLEQDNKLREEALRRDMHDAIKPLEDRISILETPWKWILTTKKGLAWISAAIASIIGIIEFIKMLRGS
jgi:hypothetical protein